MNVTQLNHNICHKCFEARLNELTYAKPIKTRYEKRARDVEKKRRAAQMTKIRIDGKLRSIRTDEFGYKKRKNRKKNWDQNMKDFMKRLKQKRETSCDRSKFKKDKKARHPQYEYWIRFEKPFRWIEYKEIQGLGCPITWHPDYEAPDPPERLEENDKDEDKEEKKDGEED